MKKILLTFSLLVLSLYGCSTKQIKEMNAPSFKRLRQLKGQLETNSKLESLSPGEEFAIKYIQAKSSEEGQNQSKACQLYKDLSSKDEFPLFQVALLKTLSLCSMSERELKNIWKETVIKPYLKESFLESLLNLAIKYQNDDLIYQIAFSSIDTKSSQNEKIKLLNLATESAKRLKNDNYQSSLNLKLIEISPRHNTQINSQNIYSIAKDFEQNRQFENARTLYLQIINGDFKINEKVKAFNAYRISFKVARDLKTFLEKTNEMEVFLKELQEKLPEDQEIAEAWVDTKINYARAIWTEHLNADARKIIEELLLKNLGTDNQKALALSIYGGLHLESKENKEAIKQYEKASKLKITNLDLQETIEWSLVWNYYLSKAHKKMISVSEDFIKKSVNPNFIAKLQFWRAKSLQALKKKSEASSAFIELTEKDQYGYYGLLASMETQTPLTPIKKSEMSYESSGFNELDWLMGFNESLYGVKLLKTLNSKFKTYKEREKAFSLYLATQWFQGGMSQVLNFPPAKRDEITTKYIDVVYPQVYENIFSKYSKRYSVPLAYSLAITRQESGFNPSVRSWADAFGLMQMIPEKATELSKEFSIPYKDFNDLYDPETNIQMGVALLNRLRSKYSGHFIQTTASYNASSSAIATWEKERFNGNYVEFVEMIPYEETRNYIKLVFRNFMTYKRILNTEDEVIPKDFFSSPF